MECHRSREIAERSVHGIVTGMSTGVADLLAAVDEAADPGRAEVLARYFQVRPGGYGEGDVFVGVQLSVLRRLARPYLKATFVAERWLPLLQSPVHEHRQIALVVMSERASRAAAGDPAELGAIYATYLAHRAHVNNWDLVDLSCGPIVGGYLVERDREPLYELARSARIWDRRIAMVGSQHFLRLGQTADLYRLAEMLLGDRHDLMHKAVGWSLREAGRRVDREQLRSFLEAKAAMMPRTALRYAIEHFDADERRHYLALR
jgi:3-methyladenine DNA glycosylase AlkD